MTSKIVTEIITRRRSSEALERALRHMANAVLVPAGLTWPETTAAHLVEDEEGPYLFTQIIEEGSQDRILHIYADGSLFTASFLEPEKLSPLGKLEK